MEPKQQKFSLGYFILALIALLVIQSVLFAPHAETVSYSASFWTSRPSAARWRPRGWKPSCPRRKVTAAYTKQAIRDKLIEHREYIERRGEDMPEIREWKWDSA